MDPAARAAALDELAGSLRERLVARVGEEAGLDAQGGIRALVERQRRQHDVHPRSVGQPCIAQRLGLVDPATERREDALDRVAQIGIARETHVRLLDAPAALDPDGPKPGHHDLVDLGIPQQRLERPQAEGPLGHPGDELLAVIRVQQPRLPLDQHPDAGLGVEAGVLPRALDQPLAQRARQLVERGGTGGGVHTLCSRPALPPRPLAWARCLRVAYRPSAAPVSRA